MQRVESPFWCSFAALLQRLRVEAIRTLHPLYMVYSLHMYQDYQSNRVSIRISFLYVN